MHVERDLLSVRGPVFITEAIRISPIHTCDKRVIAGGYTALVGLVGIRGGLYLH